MRISSALTALLLIVLSWTPATRAANWPGDKWTVNNWRKNDATATVSRDNAPDGSQAIAIEFKGKVSPNVVSPNLDTISAQWPESFGSVGFFLRGDGSGKKVSIQFVTKDRLGFSASIPLIHTGWKYITTSSLWTRDKNKPFHPNTITQIVISAPSSCSLAVGPPQFTPSGVSMNLTVGSSGIAVRTATAPVIDGKPDAAVWSRSPVMTTGHMLRNASASQNKCQFRVAFDDTNLYVLADITWAKGVHKSPPRMSRRDSPFWLDEAVEVFVNPVNDISTDYQLLCNIAGVQGDYATHFDQTADRVISDINWNGKWTSAVAEHDNGWSVEYAIPWKMMGVDGPSKVVGFQLMYDDWEDAKTSGPKYSVWSPSPMRPMDVWGILQLLDQPPADRAALSFKDVQLQRIAPGKLWLSARVEGGEASAQDAAAKLNLHAHLAGPDRQIVKWDRVVEGKGTSLVFNGALDYDGAASGHHRLSLTATDAREGSKAVPAAFTGEFNQELPVNVKYGDLVLNPRPKKMELGKGAFTLRADDRIMIDANATDRTRKTADVLAKRLYGHFGILPQITQSGNARIHLRIDPKEVAKEITAKQTDQAYLFQVTDQQIDLVGADEAGLYYAVVTLNQLMRAAHLPKSPVPSAKITDWPSILQRVYGEWVSTGWAAVKEKPDLQGFKTFLEQVVAGSKFNVFIFTVDQSFVYQKHPKLTTYPMITPEQYREIADFAREHFIEVIPGTMYGSHSNWITRYKPEWREKGYGIAQVDVTLPGVYPLMRDIYSEIIDAAGQPTHRFMIWHDEWWHTPATEPSITHNGKTRQEIFLNDLMENYNYLKSKGLKMMMWTDMIDPRHNGGPPFNLSKVVPQLPRDIIMCSWSSPPQWLHDLGFPTMKINNNFTVPPPGLEKYIDGFGTLAYRIQHSLFSWVDDQKAAAYSWHATLRTGEYAWNIGHDSNLPLAEWARQYMPNLMATYGGEPPNPLAGPDITPVELPSDSALQHELKLTGRRTIGHVQMDLGAMLVKEAGTTIKLKSPQSVSSIILLHGVQFVDDAARKAAHKLSVGYSMNGTPVGTLRMIYADGTDAQLSMRLGRNTIDMAGGRLNRYVRGGLDVLELDNGQALLQTEWVNPHPDRKLVAVELTCPNPSAPMIWAGLSRRDVARAK